MADDIAMENGSHDVEELLMKNPQPTKDHSHLPKNGDGLTDRTSGYTESQSDFKTGHRRFIYCETLHWAAY